MNIKKQVIQEFRNICYDKLLNDFDNWKFIEFNNKINGELKYDLNDKIEFIVSNDDNFIKVKIKIVKNKIHHNTIIHHLSNKPYIYIIKRFNKFESLIRNKIKYINNQIDIKNNKNLINLLPLEHQRKLKIMKLKK